jgi:hypothetical protein
MQNRLSSELANPRSRSVRQAPLSSVIALVPTLQGVKVNSSHVRGMGLSSSGGCHMRVSNYNTHKPVAQTGNVSFAFELSEQRPKGEEPPAGAQPTRCSPDGGQ